MQDLLKLAVQAIYDQECVVFPTETVYGLGANALCFQSVNRIFELKNRPPSNPLIVHVPNIQSIFSVAFSLSPLEQKLLEIFSPGPLSLILPKKKEVPGNVTGGLDTVGVRIPNHPIALEFLSLVNTPICAPSANISGKPSPTTYEMAQYYMEGKGPIILDGGDLDIGIESTVIKIENDIIYLLRAGAITSEMIADKVGILPINNPNQDHHSPGTRFTHYKPQATVLLFEENPPMLTENSALLYLNPKIDTKGYCHTFHFETIQEYMHALYHTFFQCDKYYLSTIVCELPPNMEQGTALRDRLLRASSS